jgi:beta-galactosidase/beta-glucuronidase
MQQSLDGKWKMAQKKEMNAVPDEIPVLNDVKWYDVSLPNSVQGALYDAGIVPDPFVGRNDEKLIWVEEGTWWFRKDFSVNKNWEGEKIWLDFGAVDYICGAWLNGKLLGRHEGAEGGPSYEVSRLIKTDSANTLILAVAPTKRHDAWTHYYLRK